MCYHRAKPDLTLCMWEPDGEGSVDPEAWCILLPGGEGGVL